MRKEINFESKEEMEYAKNNGDFIYLLLKGGKPVQTNKKTVNGIVKMTVGISEKTRQFFTWGAHNFKLIKAENKNPGIKFKVDGLKFKGTVKIWYNEGTDLFDIELHKNKENNNPKEINGVYTENLHSILHHEIERDDDPDV